MPEGTTGKAGGGGFAPLTRMIAAFGKHPEQKAGAPSADDAVDRVLGDLPGSCNVVRNVVLPDGRGRIGRVVLAMGGIFTIVAEGGKGTVTFDGGSLRLDARPLDADLISRAQSEATALKDHLAIVTGGEAYVVEPVIVFARAAVKVQGKAKGVRVIPLHRLSAEVIRGGSRLPAEKRERATAALTHLNAGSRMRRA